MANNERATCLVVGGGPAGMVLGLLMARAGVEVTVLEKHADFLRDFRGDTVHASTLTLLDELGLGERFAAMPHRILDRVQVQLDSGSVQVGDMSRLPGAHQHIALVAPFDLNIIVYQGRLQHQHALAVPPGAVIHEDEDAFVMVAGADNKAHRRKVTLGLTTPKLAEITSGVKAGENVIVQGQQGLPDGADIAPAK